MLYKTRNRVIEFSEDYFLVVSEAKLKATKWIGLKILTPKQILQRFPISLAEVKADNNSQSLLNKSGKLFILCINQNKLLKNIYDNIIKLIQL